MNEALKQNDTAAQDFLKNQMVKVIARPIDVRACYDDLIQQDQNTGAMTEADPGYDDMVARHQQEVENLKAKAKSGGQ